MNCYLIDDDPHAIKLLEEYLSRMENFKVIGSNLNAKKALSEIWEFNNIDIVFTDIYMPELSGFDVIDQLPESTRAIVTTVNSKYIQTAKEKNVAGFLLKPFGFENFQKVVLKISAGK